ncbi:MULTISPECIES: hypothetical protein [Photorhabdus]|uniref:Haemolysin-type calcium binding-related domain-containing protein n=1 Tax=Photorhabdus bodei TaxID=2029681 RepID=A0AAW6BGU4_9GAMM|nr:MULTISPECIES: hypothetical protein [Photorhabdus]MDB6371070.1 hypothetical protein [Photorhabdus bodei]NHB61823.1 hypothetical protein [Photorhabdus sp. RW14-46]
MAKLSVINNIINETEDSIHIVQGEENDKLHTLKRNSELKVSVRIPWIGNQDEGHKAIRITISSYDNTIWLFQDYHRPANQDQIKYYEGEEFNYQNAINVPGRSKGGGDKTLYFKEEKGKTVFRFL